MAKSGLKHIDVGAELTKTEWESEESHELIHGNSFPASPVERQLFYRDDLHKWYIYDGTAWVSLQGGGVEVHGNEYHDPDFAEQAALSAHEVATTDVHAFDKSCRVYNSVVQSIPTGLWTPLAFDSEAWDTDAIHDLDTNNSRLTCKTAGKYLITGCAAFATNTTGARFFGIKLNDTTWLTQCCFDASQAYRTTAALATIYNLAVNDYVEFLIWQNSGAALNTWHGSDLPETLSMARIP